MEDIIDDLDKPDNNAGTGTEGSAKDKSGSDDNAGAVAEGKSLSGDEVKNIVTDTVKDLFKEAGLIKEPAADQNQDADNKDNKDAGNSDKFAQYDKKFLMMELDNGNANFESEASKKIAGFKIDGDKVLLDVAGGMKPEAARTAQFDKYKGIVDSVTKNIKDGNIEVKDVTKEGDGLPKGFEDFDPEIGNSATKMKSFIDSHSKKEIKEYQTKFNEYNKLKK